MQSSAVLAEWQALETEYLGSLLGSTPPQFGKPMRTGHFPELGASRLAPTNHYLNQGGTGAVLPDLLALKCAAAGIAEQQPMSYHRDIVPVLMHRSRELVARYFGASPKCCLLYTSPSPRD